MRRLPRPNEEIFDTGVIWTPDKMPEALDAAFTEIESGGSGAGGVALLAAWFGNGRLVDGPVPAGDGERFLPPSPTLAITLPAGERFVIGGGLQTLAEDVYIAAVPTDFIGWGALSVAFDEEAGVDVWSAVWSEARPAKGAGTIYVETDADSVLLVDVSGTKSDIIPTLPYLLGLLGGGGEGGAAFWGVLERSAVDPTTIEQFIAAALAEFAKKGGQTVPQQSRDELCVNVLHSLALHQNYHNDSFAQVPPHHAFVVSPGRGIGAWTSAELTDEDLSDMPMDDVNHIFGQLQ